MKRISYGGVGRVGVIGGNPLPKLLAGAGQVIAGGVVSGGIGGCGGGNPGVLTRAPFAVAFAIVTARRTLAGSPK